MPERLEILNAFLILTDLKSKIKLFSLLSMSTCSWLALHCRWKLFLVDFVLSLDTRLFDALTVYMYTCIY